MHDCAHCGETYVPSTAHRNQLKEGQTEFFGFLVYQTIGAQTTAFEFELAPEEYRVLDLKDVGVPQDARVLSVNHGVMSNGQTTPTLPLFAGESYSDIDMPANQIAVYGKPTPNPGLSAGSGPATTKISMNVLWLASEDLPAVYPLYSSIQSFHKKRYPEAIIAANSSVEQALYLVCDKSLKRYAGNDRRKDFLDNSCTYSSQLAIMLKLICDMNNLGAPSNDLIGRLQRLRALRNDAAHKGSFSKAVKASEVYELICRAIFATHLFRAIANEIP